MKNPKNISIDTQNIYIAQLLRYVKEGIFIPSIDSCTPSTLKNINTEDDMEIMFYGKLIRLYGIEDERGCVIVNFDDYTKIKKFVENVDVQKEYSEYRKRMTYPFIEIKIIENKSDSKFKHFFDKI